jgi:predicted kinase
MSILYIYIGLPGSGKSSKAKLQVEANPNTTKHIELDMLREDMGIDPNFPDKTLMTLALQKRDEFILSNLREGFDVISSDTNLSKKAMNRLLSLAQQAKAEVKIIDLTDVPISTCIERDKLRGEAGGRTVGPEVILSLASKIRPDDPIKEEKVLVIGDIHGDYTKLLELLARVSITKWKKKWKNPLRYKLVFLGDLNDPRLDDDILNRTQMSSLKVIQIVKELWDQGIAELVQSNHQLNLINLWNGTRKSLTHGLNYTIEELQREDRYYINKLILWLHSRPYFYKFISRGLEYVCVHAYYTPGMSQYHPTGMEANDCLYGPRIDGKRYEWWLEYNQDPIVIGGHYHQVIKKDKVLILDGDCGSTRGCLLGYLVDKDEIIQVNNS